MSIGLTVHCLNSREEVKQEDRRDASPIAMTAKDIEEMNAAFAGC